MWLKRIDTKDSHALLVEILARKDVIFEIQNICKDINFTKTWHVDRGKKYLIGAR